MKYQIIPVTPFEQNCSLIWCPETLKGAFVDAGGDIDRLMAAADQRGITIEKLLLTHGHIDHAGGTGELAARLGVPIEGSQIEEKFWLDQLPAFLWWNAYQMATANIATILQCRGWCLR